tara:strand:+ start:357 stop:5018 length:4662 start_codon:yes stop_codon:yes gene_type:complete
MDMAQETPVEQVEQVEPVATTEPVAPVEAAVTPPAATGGGPPPEEYIEETGEGPEVYTEETVVDPVVHQQAADAADNAVMQVSRAGEEIYPDMFTRVMNIGKADPNYKPTDSMERAALSRAVYFEDLQRSIHKSQAMKEAIDVDKISADAGTYNEASMGIYGGFRAQVDNHPEAAAMSDDQKDQLARNNYLQYSAAKVMDELGILGHAGEIASMFLLPELDNVRSAALADALDMTYGAADFANDSAFQGRIVAMIKTLPPAESIAFIDQIRTELGELIGPDSYYAAAYLQDLTGNYVRDSKVFERNLMTGIQALEMTGIMYSVGKVMSTGKAIRKLAKLKSIEGTTQAIVAATKGELADSGVSAMDGATSMLPLDQLKILNPGSDGSLSKEVADTLEAVDLELAQVDKVNNNGVGLDKAAADAAVARGIKEIKDTEGVTEVTEVSRTSRGYTVTYKTGKGHGKAEVAGGAKVSKEALQAASDESIKNLKEAEKKLTDLGDDATEADRAAFEEVKVINDKANAELHDDGAVTRTINYVVDDQNAFKSDGVKGFMRWAIGVVSPNTVFSADRRFMVQLPEQMNFQSGAIKAGYGRALDAALGGLDKKSFQEVDLLLTKGDQDKAVYTRTQLRSGELGHEFTEDQIASYMGVRQVIDHMYVSKNLQMVNGRKAQGIKMANWGPDGQQVSLKGYRSVEAARTGFRQANTESSFIAKQHSDGSIEAFDFHSADELTEEFLQKQYSEGYELTRVQDGHLLKVNETHAEWAFVKRSDMRETSGFILNRHPGYMPKLRKNGHFFVKKASTLKIGTGTVKGAPHTIRYFDNHIEAKAWADAQPDADTLEVLADGEMSAAARESEYTNIGGGFIHGARKQTEIPFGHPDKKLTGEREDALVGLQRYVNHLAKQVPMHEYRMAIRAKWLKTANELGALKGNPVGGFDDLIDRLDTKHPSYDFLVKAHNQVKLISGVPTDAEKVQRTRTTAIAHWLEGKGKLGDWMAKKIHGKNATEAVTGVLKASTFNSLLGMYNPAQFWIQASGAFIALSINPVHGAKAIKQSMGYALMDRMIAKNPKAFQETLDWGKKQGIDIEGYEMYSKSGLRDSITSANADYQSIWEDLPYDAGRLRKMAANHTYFFKSGELVSARISYATAFNRWRSMNPNKVPDDQDLIDILGRTEQYRLNMSKANHAGFQQNAGTSVGTQFQQVNTKFMEKLFSDEFTGMEKTRMAVGQAALFGGAGVPIAGFIMPLVMDKLGLNAENLTESEMMALRNGALTWFLNDFMDINAVITGRMSLGGDFIERIWTTATEQTNVLELVAGPSSSLYEKGDNLIHQVYQTLSTDLYADELDINEVAVVSELLARSFAAVAGSTSNAVRAYDMTHSKFYRNKAGKAIFEYYDTNWQTIAAQALGFSRTTAQDYYEVNARHGGSIPKSARDIDAKRMLFIMNAIRNQDEKNGNKHAYWAINAIKSKYKDSATQDKLIKQVFALIKNPTGDVWMKEVLQLLQESEIGLTKSWADTIKMANARTNPQAAVQMGRLGVEKSGGYINAIKKNFTGDE